MTAGTAGTFAVASGLFFSVLTIVLYILINVKKQSGKLIYLARAAYVACAGSVFASMGTLGWIVYHREYQYNYAVQHTSNELYNHWFRFAATWSGQEGSFLLWATWSAVLGLILVAVSKDFEKLVVPIVTSVIGFLCAILLKQSPYLLFLKVNPGMPSVPTEGLGLNPSLQNYWMTIHPPTIFFGFASLAIPFAYALSALITRDYESWVRRVFPFALLSSGILGLGLFMGGYWAYGTLGWHGFWAWDPVENASFFPWLAVTALVHGLHVQHNRKGMAKTNLFLGILAFWLFLVGTFLTRSGALASKGANGQLLSVHAFDNISKSGLNLMVAMLVVYGLAGVIMWAWRWKEVPGRSTTGDNLLSRDFAFFMAVVMMLVACAVITLGSTTPLFLSWAHRPPMAPQASFYNKVMLPLMIPVTLLLGAVPWMAWRKTDPDTFMRKLLVPWVVMLIFGFILLLWVQKSQAQLVATMDPSTYQSTMHNWINPAVQRIMVVILGSLGFLAALSNAMLAYRVFRKRPLAAGGWIAHVGIGLLIIGVIVSNTFERTEIITLKQDGGPRTVFGYKFSFEAMTGKAKAVRPIDPEYDQNNHVVLRVTAPNGNQLEQEGKAGSFLMEPRWYVPRPSLDEESMGNPDTMFWPAIKKYLGHDLYVALANQPAEDLYSVNLLPKQHVQLGPYQIFYLKPVIQPLNYFGAVMGILLPNNQVVGIQPGEQFLKDSANQTVQNDNGQPIIYKTDESIPQIPSSTNQPAVAILNSLNPQTHEVNVLFSLPEMPATWTIPLSITYKPWVNLVWTGVLVAVFGILLSMINRVMENRRPQTTV